MTGAARRLRSALIAIPLALAAICLLPQMGFALGVALVILFALREGMLLMGWRGGLREWCVPVLGCACVLGAELLRLDGAYEFLMLGWILVGLLSLLAGTAAVLVFARTPLFFGTLAGTTAFLFAACVSGGVLTIAIRAQGSFGLSLAAVLAVIWVTDSGAYFVGNVAGRHKMIPSVSPGKTWEGTLGGVAFGLAAAALCHAGLGWFGSLSLALLSAVPIIAAAVFGDLVISALKRSRGVKDSGSFMPGHGGILDRIDSVLGAMPVAAALMII